MENQVEFTIHNFDTGPAMIEYIERTNIVVLRNPI